MTQTKSIAVIDPSLIATRQDKRDNKYNTADGLTKVPYDKIFVRKGFNLRQTFDDLEELATSIDAMGLRDPLEVDILKDGTAILLDGERRFRALGLLRSKSDEHKEKYSIITVQVNERELTDRDRNILMLTTQSQKPFSALENAEGYKRLRDGLDGDTPMALTEIAQKIGKALAHVEQCLILSDESDEMKGLINEGKVKPTTVVHLNRAEKDPQKRIAKVREANAKGERLKGKNVTQAPGVEILDGAITDIDDVIDAWNPQGVAKNILLDVQAKMRAVINIIQ